MSKFFLKKNDVYLRAVEPCDANKMLIVENDSSQWINNGMMAPFSYNHIKEYASNYDADPYRAGQLRLIIESKNKCDNSFIGIVDLYDISANFHTAFVGIYIVPEHRNFGYALLALDLLEDYVRQILNIRILASKISDNNFESIELFYKSGYKKTGELPDWLMSAGEVHTVYLFTKKLI